jgi:hypothetical protein
MSDVATKRETFRDAVEILVAREVANARPSNPGAYAGSVRSRLLNDTREHARALVEADPAITAEALAHLLDDRPDVPATPSGSGALDHRGPSIAHIDRRRACTHCHCYGGNGFTVADRDPTSALTPDAQPCGHCNVDGVRDHHHRAGTDRDDLHHRYAKAIHRHRDTHGTTPPAAQPEARTA